MKMTGGWNDIESAPLDQQIELLVVKENGEKVVEIGMFDRAFHGFYTTTELWPIRLDPVAWRHIEPIDLKSLLHIAGSTVAVLVILLMIYCFNK